MNVIDWVCMNVLTGVSPGREAVNEQSGVQNDANKAPCFTMIHIRTGTYLWIGPGAAMPPFLVDAEKALSKMR